MKNLVRVAAVALAGIVMLILTQGPASAAYAGALNLRNSGGYPLGVIHTFYGDNYHYLLGNYDKKLQFTQETQGTLSWPHVAGVWIAAGYRVDWYKLSNGQFIGSDSGGCEGYHHWFNNASASYSAVVIPVNYAC